MSVAAGAVSIVLAALLVYFSFVTFTGRMGVRRGIVELGLPPSAVPLLGAAQFAGALGLLAGLFWTPLALAAAVCLVVYFLGAVGAHVRAGHPERARVAVAILVGSALALVLVAVKAG
ncbi:DoxX family protein [Streptacidiphilus sp. P02-A3a]|uniref:DoxX family protein n=1 Tax=Streptacidiphilus sp. P02-A3a TaxID=2704468 RepID=UPI0015FA9CA7|nr:DoxX family protein [Streptacidiphilus sp. P02-A3a]QMU67347.1 DoxX family protein [Streptacidiphilus sp. P02-A3a]